MNRINLLVTSVIALVGIAGCASLDPTGDIADATDHVATRTAFDPQWTHPWDEPSPAWDGRTDLDADAAVRVALRNNRMIRREVETIVASRADYVQAHLLPNPVINVALGFPTDGMSGLPMVAALVQEIAWLWQRPHAIDAADATLRARVLSVSDAAIDLVARVRLQHAAVVLAERSVELQEEILLFGEHTVELIELTLATGETTRLALNRVTLERATEMVRLEDRRTTLATSKRALLELLGRSDAPTTWRTDGCLPETSLCSTDSEARIIELAVTQRLDVAATRAVVERHLADRGLAESGRLPDVSVGAGYQQNFDDRPAVFPSVTVRPRLFDDHSAAVAKAESLWRQAVIEADRVRQAAISQARTAWVKWQGEREAIAALEREIVAIAAENMQLARLAFDVGEVDLTVLLETQRLHNAARILLADRRLSEVSRYIDLERSVGGTLRREVLK